MAEQRVKDQIEKPQIDNNYNNNDDDNKSGSNNTYTRASFKCFNDCLHQYYISMGIKTYKKCDGMGKFLAFCELHEHDEDNIDEEMDDGAAACMYCDFDEHFPLCSDTNADDFQEEVFKVILFIYKTGKPPKPNTISKMSVDDIEKMTNKNDDDDDEKDSSQSGIYIGIYRKTNKPTILDDFSFTLTDSDICITEMKRICKEQASVIFTVAEMDDRNLFYVLALGHRNNNYKFLLHLHNAFIRDILTNKIANHERARRWLDTFQVFIKQNDDLRNKFSTALLTYSKRIFPRAQRTPVAHIKDSLRDIAIYIAMASKFVSHTVKVSADSVVPFQMDFMIAVKGCKHISDESQPNDDNEVQSDDDGDGDDNDEKQSEHTPKLGVIGDIEGKLNKKKCAFAKTNIDNDYFEFVQVEFGAIGDDAKQKLYYNTNFEQANDEKISDCIIDVKRAGLDDVYKDYRNKIITNSKMGAEYPRKRRLAVFIDRRQSHNDFRDSITMFDPPGDIRMPRKHIPEWYFDSLKKCLIPGKDGKDNISAKSPCNGELITLSFHVDQADEIRCYWIWNGTCFRFLPNDVVDILPLFFDMTFGDNQTFIESQTHSQSAKRISDFIELPDKLFDAFCTSLYANQKI